MSLMELWERGGVGVVGCGVGMEEWGRGKGEGERVGWKEGWGERGWGEREDDEGVPCGWLGKGFVLAEPLSPVDDLVAACAEPSDGSVEDVLCLLGVLVVGVCSPVLVLLCLLLSVSSPERRHPPLTNCQRQVRI